MFRQSWVCSLATPNFVDILLFLTILFSNTLNIVSIFDLLLYLKWYSLRYFCICSLLQWWCIPLSQPLIVIIWICNSLKFSPSFESICFRFGNSFFNGLYPRHLSVIIVASFWNIFSQESTQFICRRVSYNLGISPTNSVF